jgi:hypothetical protein
VLSARFARRSTALPTIALVITIMIMIVMTIYNHPILVLDALLNTSAVANVLTHALGACGLRQCNMLAPAITLINIVFLITVLQFDI